MKMQGMSQVIGNLNAQVQAIQGRTQAGLLAATMYISAESTRRAPKDTGNLKASAYFRKVGDDGAEAGFTAAYAAAVHEMTAQKLKGQRRGNFGTTRAGVSFGGGSGKGRYWDNGQPKFLESVIREKEAEILQKIIARAKF